MTYGLHDQNGSAVRDWPILISQKSRLVRQTRRPPATFDQTISEPVIYAGIIFGWFGHFITESLPNLLAVAEAKKHYPDARILAHAHGNIHPAEWKERHAGHLNYFFDKVGLDLNELEFVLTPTQARTLIVPDAPFSGKFSYKPWVFDAMDALWPMPETLRPVFLSRTRLPLISRIENEATIEEMFTDRGFEIFHPQEHGLDEQIARIRSANLIAGPQGSAMHWSLYAPMCRAVVSLGYSSPLQDGICRSRNQRYVELNGRRPRGGAYRLRRIEFETIEATLNSLEPISGDAA